MSRIKECGMLGGGRIEGKEWRSDKTGRRGLKGVEGRGLRGVEQCGGTRVPVGSLAGARLSITSSCSGEEGEASLPAPFSSNSMLLSGVGKR